MKTHSSCEIEDFVETHLCKLCVILRSYIYKYIYTVAATMTQVHPAHVMAHAFSRAGPCRGPSGATNRRLRAETRAGPHVTCAKKSQKNGLRFIFAAKNSNSRRGKQMDSMLAMCVLLIKHHARKNEH